MNRRHFIIGGLALASGTRAAGLVLRVGMPDFGPWVVPAANGVSGALPKIYDELSHGLSVSFQYVPLPVQRQMVELQQGHLEFATATPEHAKGGIQDLGTLLTFPLVLVAPPGRSYAHPGELQGKMIATLQRGANAQSFITQLKAREYDVAELPAAIHMLMEGRIDAILGLAPTILWHLKTMGLPRAAVGGFLTYAVQDFHVLARPGLWSDDPGARRRFADAIANLHQSGAVQRITSEYLPDD